MSIKSLKPLCALLALSLFSCAVACGSEETPVEIETTAPDSNGATIADAEETLTSGVPDDVDLGGRTVIMLNAPQYEGFLDLMNVEEETGDTMNDAVYKRNLEVREKLNVDLQILDYDYTNAAKETWIRQIVQSGDHIFDFIVGTQHQFVQTVAEGLYRDITNLAYVDVSQPWWAEDYIERVNFGDDKRYFIAGDISVEFLRDLDCIYYNKTVWENYYGNRNELYDVVLAGEWTIDRLLEVTKDTWRDVNGDNIQDDDDEYGYGLIPPTIPDHLFYPAGGHTIIIEGGEPVLDVVNERNITIAEKIYELYFENNAGRLFLNNDLVNQEVTIPEKFASDDFMFMFGLFYFSDFLRDMESDYGIIPSPKFDETQEEYMSLVHDGAPLVCIPMTTLDEDIDAVAAVIEEMAFQGYMIVTPEYYNVVLKQKYARDSSDVAMQILDMIRESAFTDTGYVYNYALNGAGLIVRDLVSTKQSNLATAYAAKESAAEVKLASLIEAFNALE